MSPAHHRRTRSTASPGLLASSGGEWSRTILVAVSLVAVLLGGGLEGPRGWGCEAALVTGTACNGSAVLEYPLAAAAANLSDSDGGSAMATWQGSEPVRITWNSSLSDEATQLAAGFIVATRADTGESLDSVTLDITAGTTGTVFAPTVADAPISIMITNTDLGLACRLDLIPTPPLVSIDRSNSTIAVATACGLGLIAAYGVDAFLAAVAGREKKKRALA